MIEINWLEHNHLCDNCEGSSAYGATVKVDGVLALNLIPTAYCNVTNTYTPEAVYVEILNYLGHDVIQRKL